jgi:tetratricopeptide (TPR) repeat protein
MKSTENKPTTKSIEEQKTKPTKSRFLATKKPTRKKEVKKETSQPRKGTFISPAQYETYLRSIQKFISEKKLKEASNTIETVEKIMDDVIQDIYSRSNPRNTFLCFFFSMIELSLCNDYYRDDQSDMVLLPYDYISLLSLKGQMYFFSGEIDKSKECIRKALKFNPVCTDLYFLSADINKTQFNWFSFTMDLDKLYTFLYKESDFRKYYRYLEMYYTEYDKRPDLCKILKLLGNEKSRDSLYQQFMALTTKQKSLLDEYKIPYDISKLVLDVLVNNCRNALEKNEIQQYKYFFNILSQFRNDQTINQLIHSEEFM